VSVTREETEVAVADLVLGDRVVFPGFEHSTVRSIVEGDGFRTITCTLSAPVTWRSDAVVSVLEPRPT
jgi:hypothetical protein